ncbi:hypothetical protein B2G71_08200 [Novosphingobium sp. PC22D]|uniref:hypothetical protein n=1 Tax=Novosphingobium sp. PC22D TaxID=1962403 RepID=UPI000BF0EDB8|nr:hypothetical protein [Novosphingobium sp. PC22D]PEQ13400.1 hypothetical protein B2G71_08200 [Novosphingobium sp. PC22D]
MQFLRFVMLVLGVFAIAMGLLWMGQGTGLVMWPASSFMLADRTWAVNGAVLALVGGIVVWLARKRISR